MDELNERYSAGAEVGIVRSWLVTKLHRTKHHEQALGILQQERMTGRQLTHLIDQVTVPHAPSSLHGLARGVERRVRGCLPSQATLEPTVKADSARLAA